MRLSVLAKALLVWVAGGGSLIQPALAHPGFKILVREIQDRAAEAGSQGEAQESMDSTALIGDLASLTETALSPVGRSIRSLLTTPGGGGEPVLSTEAYEAAEALPEIESAQCKDDPCCAYRHVSAVMTKAFTERSGECNSLARQAVRLGFHDAAAWTASMGPVGGADGSIVLAPEEMRRSDNRGMEEIVAQYKQWFSQFKAQGVGMADLIQFGAAHATVTCPLGPRMRFFIGRKDSDKAAPDGLLPPVDGSADFNIKLFRDKTIQPNGLAALLGAHTTSRQKFVDRSRADDPQDSTPGVWDVLYYRQTTTAVAGKDVDSIDGVNNTDTQQAPGAAANATAATGKHGGKGGGGNAPGKVFVFQSDLNIAADKRTAAVFRSFSSPDDGQQAWNAAFAREAVRLSLLGVGNINDMTECTRALPAAKEGDSSRRRP